MKNILSILFTAFILFISCELTLNAADSKEAAQVAWDKLTAYKQASNQMLESMHDLESRAKFTKKGWKSHLAVKRRVKEVLEKSTKALEESEIELRKNDKYDESWRLENKPEESFYIQENIQKDILSVLRDIKTQEQSITDYVNSTQIPNQEASDCEFYLRTINESS